MRERYRKFADWLSWKKLSIIAAGMLVLTLLPVIYLSFFNYATGDDLGYGASLHRVLMKDGSIADMVSAVVRNVKNSYFSFQGTWSSIALFSVEPSVWGERFYTVTTWIALSCLIICQGILVYELLVRYAGLNKDSFMFLFSLMLVIQTQYMPYHRSGLFWYTGMAHYVIPYGICMLGLFWMLRFLSGGRKSYLALCFFAMTYLGGAGYPEIVLAAMGFLSAFAAALISRFDKKKGASGWQNPLSRAAWLLIPLAALAAGFVISAKAPGNRIRGGADFGFDAERIVLTIKDALGAGVKDAVLYFMTARPLIIFVILTAVCAWETVSVREKRYYQRHPLVILAALYLIFSAIHAPELYVGDEIEAGISGGVYNSYFFVFTVCVLIGTVCIVGWLKNVLHVRDAGGAFARSVRIPCLFAALAACILLYPHLIGGTTDYTAVEYIRSGQLADFRRQMKERLVILEDPDIQDAVLEPMNDWQGPLMHFPVGDDPGAFTNDATARFYGKRSVVVRSSDGE